MDNGGDPHDLRPRTEDWHGLQEQGRDINVYQSNFANWINVKPGQWTVSGRTSKTTFSVLKLQELEKRTSCLEELLEGSSYGRYSMLIEYWKVKDEKS